MGSPESKETTRAQGFQHLLENTTHPGKTVSQRLVVTTHLLVPGWGRTGDKTGPHQILPLQPLNHSLPPGKGSEGKAQVTSGDKQEATNFPFKGYNNHTFLLIEKKKKHSKRRGTKQAKNETKQTSPRITAHRAMF